MLLGLGKVTKDESSPLFAPQKNGEIQTRVRYIVTSISKHNARSLYTKVYCKRGEAENLIKEHKNYLESDRTSCTLLQVNQVRQVFHTIAH